MNPTSRYGEVKGRPEFPTATMHDEIKRQQQSLKPLFPNLNDEELKAVEDTFHGYLEIAWRIFERLEKEGYFETQEKPDLPEFESPQGSALF